MDIELKPCPFCGGEARLFVSDKGVRVICSECWASSAMRSDGVVDGRFIGNSVCQVIEKWNRRVEKNDTYKQRNDNN